MQTLRAHMRRLKGTRVEEEVRARTGLIIDPYFSGAKLTWVLENNPSIKAGVKFGQVYFGTVDTWILFKLTKGRSYLLPFPIPPASRWRRKNSRLPRSDALRNCLLPA